MQPVHAARLKEVLSTHQFTRIETSFTRQFSLLLEICDDFGRPVRLLSSADCLPEFCQRLRWSKVGNHRCKQQRLRCMQTAARTGSSYITICHAGVMLACVPVMDDTALLGGLFFGRCLDEPYDDEILSDVQTRLRGLRIYPYELDPMLAQLPEVTFRQMQTAADFLYVLLYQTVKLKLPNTNRKMHSPAVCSERSQRIQNAPNDLPARLIAAIKTGSNTGVNEILNSLLTSSLIVDLENLDMAKISFFELFSTLIRNAVRTGTPLDTLMHQQIDCLHKALSVHTHQDHDVWKHRTLDKFIETVSRLQDQEKMGKLRPAIELMQTCYDRQLTLADIAGVTGLSVSRLGHLFIKQVGISPIDFLNGIRIDHVKRLLRTTDSSITRIAYDTGFLDPSYMSRVFKKHTGQTPGRYRAGMIQK